MKITVLLFATLKQRAGWNRKEVEIESGTTVADLLQWMDRQHPHIRVRQISVYVAVNEEYAAAQQELYEGDEVALFPPVSGGTRHV